MVFNVGRTVGGDTENGIVADSVTTNLLTGKIENIINTSKVSTVEKSTAGLNLAVVFIMANRLL